MKLVYTQSELLEDHDFAQKHEILDQKLHGGFDERGNYIPPRTKNRSEAVQNWTAGLRERGGEPLNADSSLLIGPRMPNVQQQRLLIKNGLGHFFWNGLTVTGKIEARGKVLATTPFPDLQPHIVEDISEMAIGHLNKGMLIAHGLDEGGQPEIGIGGHDVMWFIARDLVFGKDAYDDVAPPGSIAREDGGRRTMPELPLMIEGFLSFMMNLLLIEFRAEIGFANTQEIMRTTDLFPVPSERSELAAEIIERIRTDEKIHVDSLRLYLGELRSVHLKGESGEEIPGSKYIDGFWKSLVHWSTIEQPKLVARAAYEPIRASILASPKHGSAFLKEFDQLSDAEFQIAAGG